jgi:hypothetical protein
MKLEIKRRGEGKGVMDGIKEFHWRSTRLRKNDYRPA